jgi:hypothetical protein
MQSNVTSFPLEAISFSCIYTLFRQNYVRVYAKKIAQQTTYISFILIAHICTLCISIINACLLNKDNICLSLAQLIFRFFTDLNRSCAKQAHNFCNICLSLTTILKYYSMTSAIFVMHYRNPALCRVLDALPSGFYRALGFCRVSTSTLGKGAVSITSRRDGAFSLPRTGRHSAKALPSA